MEAESLEKSPSGFEIYSYEHGVRRFEERRRRAGLYPNKSTTETDSSGKRLLDLCGGRLAHAYHGALP